MDMLYIKDDMMYKENMKKLMNELNVFIPWELKMESSSPGYYLELMPFHYYVFSGGRHGEEFFVVIGDTLDNNGYKGVLYEHYKFNEIDGVVDCIKEYLEGFQIKLIDIERSNKIDNVFEQHEIYYKHLFNLLGTNYNPINYECPDVLDTIINICEEADKMLSINTKLSRKEVNIPTQRYDENDMKLYDQLNKLENKLLQFIDWRLREHIAEDEVDIDLIENILSIYVKEDYYTISWCEYMDDGGDYSIDNVDLLIDNIKKNMVGLHIDINRVEDDRKIKDILEYNINQYSHLLNLSEEHLCNILSNSINLLSSIVKRNESIRTRRKAFDKFIWWKKEKIMLC
jgi:hypothetical protein